MGEPSTEPFGTPKEKIGPLTSALLEIYHIISYHIHISESLHLLTNVELLRNIFCNMRCYKQGDTSATSQKPLIVYPVLAYWQDNGGNIQVKAIWLHSNTSTAPVHQ